MVLFGRKITPILPRSILHVHFRPRKTYSLPKKSDYSRSFVGEQVEMATMPLFSPNCKAMFVVK